MIGIVGYLKYLEENLAETGYTDTQVMAQSRLKI